MTTHATMRQALAASIIAAEIGWDENSVMHKRTTSLWNDIATAVSVAKGGIVLHIGVTSGKSVDDDDLHMELDVPITIVCAPSVEEETEPAEEQLWEDLVRHVGGLVLEGDQHAWRFKFDSFSDIEVEADDGTSYFGRQTVFKKQLSL